MGFAGALPILRDNQATPICRMGRAKRNPSSSRQTNVAPHRARKGKAAIRVLLGSHGIPCHGQPSMRVSDGNHHERAYPGVVLVEAGDELIVFAARA